MMFLPPALRILLLQAQSHKKASIGKSSEKLHDLLITKQVTILVPLNLYKFHVKEFAGVLRDVESQQKRHTSSDELACSGPHWHMLALAAKAPAVLDFMTCVVGMKSIRVHSTVRSTSYVGIA